VISDYFLRIMFWTGGRGGATTTKQPVGDRVRDPRFRAPDLRPIIAALMQMAVSRKREYLADASECS